MRFGLWWDAREEQGASTGALTHDTGYGEVRLEAHVGGVVTALRGVGGEGVLRFGQRAVGVLAGGVVLADGVVGGCEVAHFVCCG